MKGHNIEKVLQVGVICTFTFFLSISCKMLEVAEKEAESDVRSPEEMEAAWEEEENTALG